MGESKQSININQDITGSIGELTEKQYDIHCHAISGGENTYMMNYYKSSCAIRLENGSCKRIKCPRFYGKQTKRGG